MTPIDPARIPAECISAAMRQLPSAALTREPQTADIDVPAIGMVRFSFEWRKQARKGFPAIWVMVGLRGPVPGT